MVDKPAARDTPAAENAQIFSQFLQYARVMADKMVQREDGRWQQPRLSKP